MSFTPPCITPVVNPDLEEAIWARLDNLTKPPRSLGYLEDLVVRYCLCRGSEDADLKEKELFVFAGDHGITEQKVTPYPKEVTPQMVLNMVAGGAAITVMCKTAGVKYSVVDTGVDYDFTASPGLFQANIRKGTRDFSRESAMTTDECARALQLGVELSSKSSADIFAIGEMGIGNTSSASALIALLIGLDGAEAVGMGTGAQGKLLEHKTEVIGKAVRMHREQTDGTPLDMLCRVGGLEIAAMAGSIIGAASTRRPVVVDGFIATSAALAATRLAPNCRDYLIFGHVSSERFHRSVLEQLGARPLLDLGMRLGEGTGAVLALQIVEQAMHCYHYMATFASAGVSNKDD